MNKTQTAWNMLLAVSVVVIFASAFIAFVMPKPTSNSAAKTRESVKAIWSSTAKTDTEIRHKLDRIRARTWYENEEIVGARVLDIVTKQASANGVQLSRFHTGVPVVAEELTEARFNVTMEGGFLNVMALMHELEKPTSKVAPNDLKITTAAGSDHVTATIALTAFLNKEAK